MPSRQPMTLGLWQCLCATMHVNRGHCVCLNDRNSEPSTEHGRSGFAERVPIVAAAHWASWGDCLEVVRDRCLPGLWAC